MTDQSTDGDALDLTPRSVDETTTGGGFKWKNWVIAGAFVAVAGGILFQALTNARVYFYNVDEAVGRQGELDDSTFRMQGTVVDEPATTADGSLAFTMSFGGVDATVKHVGAEPSDMFRKGEQVVAEGRWTDEPNTFQSSQLLVKHDAEYVEDNPGRVENLDTVVEDAS